jgi:hypothetical protein
MKKVAFISFLAVIIVFSMSLLLNTKQVIGSKKENITGPGVKLPDSIQKFVQRACMDCHADDGSSMARSKINFSKWETYDDAKQAKKANAMCKELTKAGMPTKKWRENNPNDIPTKAEVDMVCRWANSLQK